MRKLQWFLTLDACKPIVGDLENSKIVRENILFSAVKYTMFDIDDELTFWFAETSLCLFYS